MNISRESKVASNVLESCPHLVSEKTIKIAVCAIKAYILKSILPTSVRFLRVRSQIIIMLFFKECKFAMLFKILTVKSIENLNILTIIIL